MTVGAGLSSYHGDLDWNPTDGPAEFLAAGNLGVFVAADRSLGSVVTEAALRYDRFAIDYPQVEMTMSTASLVLSIGYRLDLLQFCFAPLAFLPSSQPSS